MPRLEARGVSYRAGEALLLDGVSIELRPGEVLALVGPNGAGKSTLLRVLAGDLAPTAGEVLLDGAALAAFSPRALALQRAVMPQQTVLQFSFTAFEVALMGRSPHLGTSRGESETDLAIVREALARADVLALAGRAYPSLSTGEQQRVTLARVLAQQSPILLLDEPTSALDIRHQELVMAIARERAAAGGAVLIVVHDLNLAAACAGRVAVLQRGRLVACGTPWQVLTAELLSRVFEHSIAVLSHPLDDRPLILPIPSTATASADPPPLPKSTTIAPPSP
ncbi:MAG TPA: heme ABC transporter ATP-binding protein [Dehalococcoidia bacterium]|nr:heme ABC transporter ATP-binding protein [Dehalococcoidia bacterium]